MTKEVVLNDNEINPLGLKIDNKKLLNIIDAKEINIDNYEIENILNILNRSILYDSDEGINLNYDDVLSILTSSNESYVISVKTNIDTIFEMVDLFEQMSKEIDRQDKVKGIILNFRLSLDYQIEVMLKFQHLIENPDCSCTVIFGTTIDNRTDNDVEIVAIISI